MTVAQAAQTLGFEIACPGEGLEREISGVYCCDLLSLVMGRAPAGCLWVTVMGNLNAIAVAVLADAACIVLAEGMPLDEAAAAKAQAQGVTVLRTPLPVFAAAKGVDNLL